MAHVEAGELRVHWVDLVAGPGPGSPIVFVHGNWSTHRWWIPTATELAVRTGRRLIAYDLRGRGATEGPDHGYSVAELADDLGALLDALALLRVHLVGHSLGAAIASEFALTRPDRVASLVAVAQCWPDGMPEAWARRADQAALHHDRDRFARLLSGMAPSAPRGPLWDEIVATSHDQREVATLANLDALIAWRPGDRLRALAMPRVVVDGELDRLCGGPTATRAATAMTCPRVSMFGVGHSPNLEAPSQLASIIRRIVRCGE